MTGSLSPTSVNGRAVRICAGARPQGRSLPEPDDRADFEEMKKLLGFFLTLLHQPVSSDGICFGKGNGWA
jgi:hypothetical protein